MVEQTFVHESQRLVHINVGDETIITTPEHPFYVPKKGFVNAVDLRAGDILWTVNGEYVIIEKIQHEILETPIDVFNFTVGNNHTYFVGSSAVGVHNKPAPNPDPAPNNKMPANDSQLKHIFRGAEGHFTEDTPANRAVLEDVANDPNCKLGTDSRGETWYARETADGKQIWVECRNGTIRAGGINEIPKTFNPQTGLKAQTPLRK